MESLIQVFRMEEISWITKIRILKQLGISINHQYGSNITEPLVYELVLALNPNDEIKNDEHYKKFITNPPQSKDERDE